MCLREKFSIKLCLTVFQDWKQKKIIETNFQNRTDGRKFWKLFFIEIDLKRKIVFDYNVRLSWVEAFHSVNDWKDDSSFQFSVFSFFPKQNFDFDTIVAISLNCITLKREKNFNILFFFIPFYWIEVFSAQKKLFQIIFIKSVLILLVVFQKIR